MAKNIIINLDKIIGHILIGIVTLILLPVQIVWFMLALILIIISFFISCMIYNIFKTITLIFMIEDRLEFKSFLGFTDYIWDNIMFLVDIRGNMNWYLIEHLEYSQISTVFKNKNKKNENKTKIK
jgi:hypothetical protein